jgi:hypothetical protein
VGHFCGEVTIKSIVTKVQDSQSGQRTQLFAHISTEITEGEIKNLKFVETREVVERTSHLGIAQIEPAQSSTQGARRELSWKIGESIF